MVDARIMPLDRGRVRADRNYVIEGYELGSATNPNPETEMIETPVYHETELKYAYYSAKTSKGDPAYLASDFDHELNWRVVHGERESHFEGIDFLHLPGHTPGLMGLHLALPETGSVLVAGDQAYVAENYREERPLGPGLLWSKRDWYDSLRTLQDLERREDATLFFGHDPGSLSRLEGGLR